MTDIRVTREALEVVGTVTTTPNARVTRVGMEVLADVTTTPDARVTRVGLEVLGTLAEVAPLAAARRVISINYT